MGKRDNRQKGKDDKKFVERCTEIKGLIDSGNTAKALLKLRKHNMAYKKLPAFCVLWGTYYEAKENFSKASEWYLKAIELDKKEEEYYRLLTNAYHRSGRQDDAIEILRQGTHNCSDPVKVYLWLEQYACNISRKDIAVEAIEEIKARYKDQGELYYKRGEAAFALGLNATAIDFFRQSLEHGYVGPHQNYYLAESYGAEGYIQLASDNYVKALAKDPDNSEIYNRVYDLIRWKSKNADDYLLAALTWKKATLLSEVSGQIQPFYLDLTDAQLQEELDGWMSSVEYDIKADYNQFCHYFTGLLLFEEGSRNYLFDLKKSLISCIAKLHELKESKRAVYYEAWLACANKSYDSAESKFKLLQADDATPGDLKGGIERGFEYIKEHRPSVEEVRLGGLNKYGFNLSTEVSKCKMPPAIGFDKIASEMADILAHSTMKSIILTGKSGVGKTAAIRQLAHAINTKNCPPELKGYRIYQISTTAILNNVIYIGQWQHRLEEVCRIGAFDRKVLIYLEDIANIFGAGKTTGDESNFSDYLIPLLERGQVALIAEMDAQQAQALFWKHPRFEKVVTQISVKEPLPADMPEIVRYAAESERADGDIVITPDSINETIALTQVLMPYKAFPGKAVDVLNRAIELFGSDTEKDKIKITVDDIILTFCEMTGTPDAVVDRNQQLDQKKMQTFFCERILGQEEAIESLMSAVVTLKARLCDERKPIRSFMFVGPTGVGKTESAKVLAEYLFGSQEKIIRVNMSEYNDSTAVSKLLGLHFGQGPKASRFLDEVRKNPFSVVLLDEIEKAHPDVLNLLLQLLDEGTLTDGEGKQAYFQSAIIIMTSNIGSRYYTSKSIGFGSESNIPGVQQEVMNEVTQFFTPEIFNRFDEVICFSPLSKNVLQTIINREIGKVLERKGVIDNHLSIDIDQAVKEYIVDIGYDPKYGARHIKRAVEKAVALPLARLIASTKLPAAGQVRINLRKGKPVADIVVIEEKLLTDQLEVESKRLILSDINFPDRGLKKTLSSMDGRISSLKSKLKYDEILEEKENLQAEMVRPVFWDDPGRANTVLRKFAELNRKTERIHRWENILDRIGSTLIIPAAKRTKAEISHAKSQIIGLMKDLESAEMEILLEGRYDSADAYIILSSERNDKEGIKWMLELTGVYTTWARRRGYHFKIFGEQPSDDNSGACKLLLHIGGLNAFGLLKNERGIHRKTIYGKSKKKPVKINHDCRVIVLADVQTADGPTSDFKLDVRKISPPRKGWKIKSLCRRVAVSHKSRNIRLDFLSDTTVDGDRKLPGELFLSYMHYQQRKRTSGSRDDGVWGSLVRSYELGDKTRIVDYASKTVIKNVKDYLGGKIDSLLLERLI